GSLLLKHRLGYPSHQQKYLFFICKGVVQRALRYLWWNQLTLSTLMSFHPPDVLLPRPHAPILQSTDSFPLPSVYPLPRDNTRVSLPCRRGSVARSHLPTAGSQPAEHEHYAACRPRRPGVPTERPGANGRYRPPCVLSRVA